jgi:hypothetical protein
MTCLDFAVQSKLALNRKVRREAMKEEAGVRDGADMDEGTGMDAQSAAVIMQEARERARRELTVNHPAIFATWALERRIYSLSLATGLLGVVIMQAALRYDGASRGVIGVFQASAPLLVAGVVLVAGTAAWLNWYMFGLGIWLIAVTAFSGFAGPAGVWAVDALAVGVPFLAMAAIALARGRS